MHTNTPTVDGTFRCVETPLKKRGLPNSPHIAAYRDDQRGFHTVEPVPQIPQCYKSPITTVKACPGKLLARRTTEKDGVKAGTSTPKKGDDSHTGKYHRQGVHSKLLRPSRYYAWE